MQRYVYGALVLGCLSGPAHAQQILSETDALARLTGNTPRARAARAPIDVAQAEARAALRWPNPRVAVQREAVSGVAEVLSTVQQLLPITGRRTLEHAALTALTGAAAARSGDVLRVARADLRRAYVDLAVAQARAHHTAETAERLRVLAAQVAARERAGDAAGYDRLRVERDLIELEADREAVSAEVTRARGALASILLDVDDPASLVVAALPAARPPLPPVETLVTHAETTRGDLAALHHEQASAGLAARAADRRRIPEPEVVGGTKSASPSVGGAVGSVIAVQATIPLFDKGRIDRAIAETRGRNAALHAEALVREIRADVRAVYATLIERRTAADRYRRAAAASAGELVRIATVAYEAGERGIFELVDAYRSVAQVQSRQLTLDAAVRYAEIELELVTGWEIQ